MAEKVGAAAAEKAIADSTSSLVDECSPLRPDDANDENDRPSTEEGASKDEEPTKAAVWPVFHGTPKTPGKKAAAAAASTSKKAKEEEEEAGDKETPAVIRATPKTPGKKSAAASTSKKAKEEAVVLKEEEKQIVFRGPPKTPNKKAAAASTSKTAKEQEEKVVEANNNEEKQAAFGTPQKKGRGRPSKKTKVDEQKAGGGVVKEEGEEEQPVFLTPTPVAKRKGGGGIKRPASSSTSSTAKKRKEEEEGEDTDARTGVSVAPSVDGGIAASFTSLTKASPAPSSIGLADELRRRTVVDPRDENDTPEERLLVLSRKYARLMQDRGTYNARIDMMYPELAKVSEFGEGPFVYTSGRRRAQIAAEIAAVAAQIKAGKTTRSAREKAAASLRARLYDSNDKQLKAIKKWIKEEVAAIEEKNKEAVAIAETAETAETQLAMEE